jgi:hypothetical protein
LFFISFPSFSPIAGTKYADFLLSVSEPHRCDSPIDIAEAEETSLFFGAVLPVDGDDPIGIQKGALGFCKEDPMLIAVDRVFGRIPFEFHQFTSILTYI